MLTCLLYTLCRPHIHQQPAAELQPTYNIKIIQLLNYMLQSPVCSQWLGIYIHLP